MRQIAIGEFIQNYGSWILFGLFFLFMLRMHSGGMHDMGGGSDHSATQHSGHQEHQMTDTKQDTTSAVVSVTKPDAPAEATSIGNTATSSTASDHRGGCD